MMFKLRWFIAMLSMAVLAGCVSMPIPNETQADSTSQKTVIRTIKFWELSLYHCSTLKLNVIDIKVTTPFDGKESHEKWNVLSCNGEKHSYDVRYQPSPSRGTFVSVAEWGKGIFLIKD
jgi:ABC-type glycerol-3-phosphate transport system substrate-binding protein